MCSSTADQPPESNSCSPRLNYQKLCCTANDHCCRPDHEP
ncbi:hypothetical protein T4E_4957 [Trichinella pseudospiralis]|uniref:Uncharacterized protein n=1 Tax=Trichinella pseudospiralis TaxID=6337 RepID=A0A0V0W6Q5_TRIPS|nr:hypothetical protein T4E_4957 [Trichinella pseudospiralis]